MTLLIMGVIVFTAVILLLVGVIINARRMLVSAGVVTININHKKDFQVPTGGKLLNALADTGYSFPQLAAAAVPADSAVLPLLRVPEIYSPPKRHISTAGRRKRA